MQIHAQSVYIFYRGVATLIKIQLVMITIFHCELQGIFVQLME